GKLIHDPYRPVSRVDLNRAGTPLMEIVSEPDMRTPEEAGAYLKVLHAILRYLDISDANMEEGNFRCDANVSIRPKGQDEFGTRAELKNMNSFRNVERALAYEIERQTILLEEGGQVVQETRLYDAAANRTHPMRGKEDAHDYRYFPDPDLVPVMVDNAWIEEQRRALPELPHARRSRFMAQYGLSEADAAFLCASRETADYFEQCAQLSQNFKAVFNWISGELTALLNARNLDITQCPISAHNLSELLKLIEDGTISGKIAKTVFEKMAQSGQGPVKIVEESGLVQVTDEGVIAKAVDEVLAAHPEEVAAYKGGKKKLMGFFVGKIMQKTQGKANPKLVNQLVSEKLEQ
ncbi:MAG: Asp-tRNA(Asn)/Glu-tRNA(Gln) amidotransferase subunit GatB, partial [Desulfatibacillaceae bacterium]|nr:Asp-tRNA(Asn)/Glu-tRNA(Gln) amidotransferase subunit GatB [Desulfatibacillaceae bacterium]